MPGLGIIKKEKTTFTKEELQSKLPEKKNTITDRVVNLINEANNDPMFNGDEFMKTMIDYKSVMEATSGSIPEYINALRFCAYLEAEGNITDAYKKARANDKFVQDRCEAVSGSADYSALTAAASRYRKNPMVRQILTQSDMPLYLMFQGSRYKAVAVLADEMENSAFAKDRINAADKLLTHVKPPENIQVELDVGVKESSALEDLNMQLAEIAIKQKRSLEMGVGTLEDFGSLKPREEILDAEVTE